jgi:hypothetical protein
MPKYCYEVWIKHLTMLNEHDSVPVPKTFAELGPGASLGVGLAALLSGADTYYALDIIKYSEVDLSLALLRGLVDLFRNRTPVYTGWPIDSEVFPGHILNDDLLEATVAEPRIEEIHRSLTAPDGRAGSITIEYTVPWNDPSVIRRGEVDLIVSQAVLDAARRRPRGLQPPRPDAARADDRRAHSCAGCPPATAGRHAAGASSTCSLRASSSTRAGPRSDRGPARGVHCACRSGAASPMSPGRRPGEALHEDAVPPLAQA